MREASEPTGCVMHIGRIRHCLSTGQVTVASKPSRLTGRVVSHVYPLLSDPVALLRSMRHQSESIEGKESCQKLTHF